MLVPFGTHGRRTIRLNVSADEVTKLEPGFADAPAVPTATRR
jgi:hypothetical protein